MGLHYLLVSTIRNWRQIANEKSAKLETEFFNSIRSIAVTRSAQLQQAARGQRTIYKLKHPSFPLIWLEYNVRMLEVIGYLLAAAGVGVYVAAFFIDTWHSTVGKFAGIAIFLAGALILSVVGISIID